MYIAIDPSYNKNIGIAWTKDSKKIEFDSIVLDKCDKNPETRDIAKIAEKVFNYIIFVIKPKINLNNKTDLTIAIESQWMGLNPEMTMTLVELRGMIEGMCYLEFKNLFNLKLLSVNPRSWQSNILHIGRAKSEEIKKESIKYASDLTKKTVTEDEADSICILKHIIK